MTNKQNTPSPLWRELNERRTPGTLSITATKNHFFLEQPDGNGGADTFCTFSNVHEGQETNAQYTALAVNHFASLAEALEGLTKEINLSKLNIKKDFLLINAHAAALKVLAAISNQQQ